MGEKGKIGAKAASRRELEGLEMTLTVAFQLKACGRNPRTLEKHRLQMGSVWMVCV